MIYTITFNPALDYIVRLEQLKTGTINRTTQEYVLGGGKGINVSIVLNNLGMDTTALGFIAGFTGEEIVTQLNSFGVKEDFIRLREGLTRINVKVKASDEEIIKKLIPKFCFHLTDKQIPLLRKSAKRAIARK